MAIMLGPGDIKVIDVSMIPAVSSVIVLNPIGGETWARGQTYEIRWEAQGLDEVEVVYRHHQNSHIISRPVTGSWLPLLPANPGSYYWTIPYEHWTPVEPGNYTIRVNGYKNGSSVTFHESPRFTIA